MGERQTRTIPSHMGSGSIRQNILVQAAQEFCALPRPARKQIEQYRDLFYSLVSNCSEETKRSIAVCHANNVHTPRTIAYYLALDTSVVASPILLFSPVFNTKDLVSLAERTTEKHRQSIAHRNDLAPELVEILLKSKDEDTLRMLAKNPAVLQNKTSLSLLQEALEESIDQKEKEPLVTQDVETKAEALESTTAQQTGSAGSLFQADNPETLSTSQQQTSSQTAYSNASISGNQELLDLAAKGGRLGRRREEPSKTQEPVPATPIQNRLLNAARANDIPQVEAVIALETKINREDVQAILADDGCRRLARLLRGLMITKTDAMRLMLLIKPVLGREAGMFREMNAYFERQAIAFCQQEILDLGGILRTRWAEQPIPVETPDSLQANEDTSSANLRQAMRSRRQALSRSQRRSQFGRRDEKSKSA